MRLFVAIELPDRLRSALAKLRESLDPGSERARWVRASSMHLTLKFLGEVDATRVSTVEEALSPIRARKLHLEIRGIGFFPASRAPRILWAGISSDGLAALASKVDDAMHKIGFPQESRPFRPHLTLARAARKGTIERAVVLAADPWAGTDFGSFNARSFCLYQSHLEAAGAIYEKLAEFVFDRTS